MPEQVYIPPDPRALYGEPDLVLRFRPLEEDREQRERAGQGIRKHLAQVAPVPARGDRSPEAARARKLRARIQAAHRKSHPLVGGHLVPKKNHTTVRRRGHRIGVGKSATWKAFEAWALTRLRQELVRMPGRQHLPYRSGVHLVWRYTPPSLEAYPDHPGVYETVADLVQDLGMVIDDVQIQYDDLSRIEAPDPESPRLEIWVRPLGTAPGRALRDPAKRRRRACRVVRR